MTSCRSATDFRKSPRSTSAKSSARTRPGCSASTSRKRSANSREHLDAGRYPTRGSHRFRTDGIGPPNQAGARHSRRRCSTSRCNTGGRGQAGLRRRLLRMSAEVRHLRTRHPSKAVANPRRYCRHGRGSSPVESRAGTSSVHVWGLHTLGRHALTAGETRLPFQTNTKTPKPSSRAKPTWLLASVPREVECLDHLILFRDCAYSPRLLLGERWTPPASADTNR